MFTKLSFAVITTLVLTSSTAFASNCDGDSPVVFSCMGNKGKVIEVCDGGPTLHYFYGKSGAKPDLILSVGKDADLMTVSHVRPGAAVRSVSFEKGNYGYEVYASEDPKHSYAGVNVTKGGNNIASIDCAGPVIDKLALIAQ